MRPHDLVFRVSVGRKSCEGQINWNRSGIRIPWPRRGWNRNLAQYRKLKNALFLHLSVCGLRFILIVEFSTAIIQFVSCNHVCTRVFGQGEACFYVTSTKNCIIFFWARGCRDFFSKILPAFGSAHSSELFLGQQLDQWLHWVLDEVRVGENILGIAMGVGESLFNGLSGIIFSLFG